ncbi:tycC, partial [Symbiodinium necroappetens]
MKRRAMALEATDEVLDNAKRPCVSGHESQEATMMEEDQWSFEGVVGLDEAFDKLATRYPQRPAVEDEFGCAWTYLDLQQASLRLAKGFLEMLPTGDTPPVVALLLRRSCLWVASCLAASRLGPVLALSCDLGTEEEVVRSREALAEHRPRLLVLEHAVRDAAAAAPLLESHANGAALVFADTLHSRQVAAFYERPQAWGSRHLDDALWLVYTGGTTAASKCVVQTHRMAIHELRTYPDFGVMTCEDRILHHTSAFWGATCLGLFDLPWSCGGCLVILGRHGLAEVAQAIEQRHITVAGLVPSLLDALTMSRCTSLRTVFTWGEALRPSTAAAWCSQVQLLDLLIASEYWLVLCADHRQSRQSLDGFRPVRGARLQLLSAQQEDTASPHHVSPGEVGELYIAGPMVSAQGYTKAILNEGSFVDLPGADGQLVRHYRTRDLARWTRDGALEYCGRADGFAKVGGKWLDLASVERKLQEAGCKEAALLWDEEYKVRHAVVVLTDAKLECSLAAQVAQLEAHLPPQTCLHLLQSLPKLKATPFPCQTWLMPLTQHAQHPLVASIFNHNVAIGTCERQSEWQQALLLLAAVRGATAQANTFSFCPAISACAKGRRWAHALALLGRLGEETLEATIVAFNSAVSACEWRMALGLLNVLSKSDQQADVISYNSAISKISASSKSAWHLALHLLARMAMGHLRVSLVTCNSSVSAVSECSQWQWSQACISQLLHQLVEADVISYNASIIALEGWEEAVEGFTRLHACKVQASIVTYNSVITSCREHSRWHEAMALMEDIREASVTPTVVSYGAAVSAFQSGGQWQAALALLEDMARHAVPANVIIYGAAISTCEEDGNWQQALGLLTMIQQGRLQLPGAAE